MTSRYRGLSARCAISALRNIIIMIIDHSYEALLSNLSLTHCTVQTTHDKNHTNIHFSKQNL